MSRIPPVTSTFFGTTYDNNSYRSAKENDVKNQFGKELKKETENNKKKKGSK